MKKIIVVSCMLFVSMVFTSASTEKGDAWLTNFGLAKKKAKESEKNILMVFSGSDWCSPCIRLQKILFESDEFKTFADENLVLLELDFPRKGKNMLSKEQQEHNQKLAAKYNPRGAFPTVVVVDAEGKVLGTMAHPKSTVPEYIENLRSILSN